MTAPRNAISAVLWAMLPALAWALGSAVGSRGAGPTTVAPVFAAAGIRFEAEPGRPTRLRSVSLPVRSDAPPLRIRVARDGPWYPCRATATGAECQTPGALVAGASIVAVEPVPGLAPPAS